MPSYPIENVSTGCVDSMAIAATTALESIPPDRNAPSGTSLIRWLLTLSRNW